jgi:GNAT superfamily N-acetyltransferase
VAAVLSPALLEAALFPEFDLPLPPPGHPYRVRTLDGYRVGYTPGSSFALVSVRRFGDDLEGRVAEVRALLAAEGFERAAWMVAEAAEPAGLAGRLEEFGLVSWPRETEGFGPRYRNMVLAAEPAPMPVGVVARQVATFDEFVAARSVAHGAFELSEHDRELFERRNAVHWEWHERASDFKTFAAFVDGEIVGNAGALFGANAAFLIGGSVREDARGRGAYRALVRARWDAAVARGTSALTVSAGEMSGPILERLGFATVGEGDGLEDRFPSS